jgi:hypothetical protein
LPHKSKTTLSYWVKIVIIKGKQQSLNIKPLDIIAQIDQHDKRYFFSSFPNAIILRDIVGATVSAVDEWIDSGLEK